MIFSGTLQHVLADRAELQYPRGGREPEDSRIRGEKIRQAGAELQQKTAGGDHRGDRRRGHEMQEQSSGREGRADDFDRGYFGEMTHAMRLVFFKSLAVE